MTNEDVSRLWSAVVLRAIKDTLCIEPPYNARAKFQREAMKYIVEDKDFIEICSLAGFDDIHLRKCVVTYWTGSK